MIHLVFSALRFIVRVFPRRWDLFGLLTGRWVRISALLCLILLFSSVSNRKLLSFCSPVVLARSRRMLHLSCACHHEKYNRTHTKVHLGCGLSFRHSQADSFQKKLHSKGTNVSLISARFSCHIYFEQ